MNFKKWKKVAPILKWFFITWGVISLIGVIIIGGYIAHIMYNVNRAKIDKASSPDVRFVLNGCGLGEERIKKVVHSYESVHPFLKDHYVVYAIKIADVKLGVLFKSTYKWYRGDQLPNVLDEAVSFVRMWGAEDTSWFPNVVELRSKDVYIYPEKILYYGLDLTEVKMVILKPKEKMIYYFSAST